MLPIGAGLAGSIFLTGLYLGLVSWAESFPHAIEFLWQDRWIVVPIILGFGIQVAIYVILKKRLFMPVASAGPSGVAVAGTAVGVGVSVGAMGAGDVLVAVGEAVTAGRTATVGEIAPGAGAAVVHPTAKTRPANTISNVLLPMRILESPRNLD